MEVKELLYEAVHSVYDPSAAPRLFHQYHKYLTDEFYLTIEDLSLNLFHRQQHINLPPELKRKLSHLIWEKTQSASTIDSKLRKYLDEDPSGGTEQLSRRGRSESLGLRTAEQQRWRQQLISPNVVKVNVKSNRVEQERIPQMRATNPASGHPNSTVTDSSAVFPILTDSLDLFIDSDTSESDEYCPQEIEIDISAFVEREQQIEQPTSSSSSLQTNTENTDSILQAERVQAAIASSWRVYMSEEGFPYHFNSITQESSWDCPLELYIDRHSQNRQVRENEDEYYRECECIANLSSTSSRREVPFIYTNEERRESSTHDSGVAYEEGNRSVNTTEWNDLPDDATIWSNGSKTDHSDCELLKCDNDDGEDDERQEMEKIVASPRKITAQQISRETNDKMIELFENLENIPPDDEEDRHLKKNTYDSDICFDKNTIPHKTKTSLDSSLSPAPLVNPPIFTSSPATVNSKPSNMEFGLCEVTDDEYGDDEDDGKNIDNTIEATANAGTVEEEEKDEQWQSPYLQNLLLHDSAKYSGLTGQDQEKEKEHEHPKQEVIMVGHTLSATEGHETMIHVGDDDPLKSSIINEADITSDDKDITDQKNLSVSVLDQITNECEDISRQSNENMSSIKTKEEANFVGTTSMSASAESSASQNKSDNRKSDNRKSENSYNEDKDNIDLHPKKHQENSLQTPQKSAESPHDYDDETDPKNWEVNFTDDDDIPYHFNFITGTSVWDCPHNLFLTKSKYNNQYYRECECVQMARRQRTPAWGKASVLEDECSPIYSKTRGRSRSYNSSFSSSDDSFEAIISNKSQKKSQQYNNYSYSTNDDKHLSASNNSLTADGNDLRNDCDTASSLTNTNEEAEQISKRYEQEVVLDSKRDDSRLNYHKIDHRRYQQEITPHEQEKVEEMIEVAEPELQPPQPQKKVSKWKSLKKMLF